MEIVKRINLMSRQVQDLVCLTKLQVMLDTIFIPKWTKVLHTHEKSALKSARTNIHKAVINLLERTDTEDLKSYVKLLNNTNLINIPKMEYYRTIETLNKDTDILDIALMQCNPCTMRSPAECVLRQKLDDNNFPPMWDSSYNYMHDLTEEEKRCMNHCKHCVNLKL